MRLSHIAIVLALLALLSLGSVAEAGKGGNGGGGGGGGGKPGGGDPPPPTPPSDPDVVLMVNTRYDDTAGGTLHVMNADGSEKTEIYGGYVSGRPCWSRDGAYILFGGDSAGPGIYRIKPDGTDLAKVVATATAPFKLDVSPVASPDGKAKIVFEDWVDTDGNGVREDIDLFVVNEDGSDLVNVTNTPTLRERHPSWSHGGDKLAFARQASAASLSPQDVLVMEFGIDTGGDLVILGETNLSDGIDVAGSALASEADVRQPDWARTDDKLVVIVQGSDGVWDALWVIDFDDPSNPVEITSGLSDQVLRQPTWASDDSMILYNGANDVYPIGSLWTIDADGSNRAELVRREGAYSKKRKTWPDNNCMPFWKR